MYYHKKLKNLKHALGFFTLGLKANQKILTKMAKIDFIYKKVFIKRLPLSLTSLFVLLKA